MNSDLNYIAESTIRKRLHVSNSKNIGNWGLNLIQIKTRDLVQKHTLPLSSLLLLMLFFMTRFIGMKNKSFSLLMKAHRVFPLGIVNLIFRKYFKELLNHQEFTLRDAKSLEIPEKIYQRLIVLKLPKIIKNKIIEKGLVVIKFTETFSVIQRKLDAEKLLDYFFLVLEPSWSGYCDIDILSWARYNKLVIVQSADVNDRKFLEKLNTSLIPVECGSGDWVNYNLFRPITTPKIYDVIYVANYNYIKRIHIYINTLRKLRKRSPNIKGALVCAHWGGSRDAILSLVNHYDLWGCLDIYEQLSAQELNYVLNQSKVNVLLSLKEGSNRSLFEGMFANVPSILIANNVGVNKNNINKHTGMIVTEEKLDNTILHFKSNWQRYSPREWAMEHISPEKSCDKLVKAINSKDEFANIDRRQVLVKVNHPEMEYFDSCHNKLDINKKFFEIFTRDAENNIDNELKNLKL